MLPINVELITAVFPKKDSENFFDICKKNTPSKITSTEDSYALLFSEPNMGEKVFVEHKININDSVLAGNECKNNYDCPKSADIMYFYFFSQSDKASSYLFDLKKTVGTGVEVIEHLVDQWINAIRYSWSVLAYYHVKSSSIYLGFITERYDEKALSRIIQSEKNELKRQSDVPSVIGGLQRKRTRSIPKIITILENFFSKKLVYEGKSYNINCFLFNEEKRCTLKFNEGALIP